MNMAGFTTDHIRSLKIIVFFCDYDFFINKTSLTVSLTLNIHIIKNNYFNNLSK